MERLVSFRQSYRSVGVRAAWTQSLSPVMTRVCSPTDVSPAAVQAPCCMCNCKSTLQAILQEIRTMRRLMQTQKGSQEKQEHTTPPWPPCPVSPAPCRRPRKRRPVHKVAPMSAPSKRAAVPPLPPCLPLEPGGRRETGCREMERPVHTPASPATSTSPDLSVPTLSMQNKPIPSDEMHLAEDYEVFIPKAQLDSILVCTFFADTTLANSLPNGKRKRGLNDHRKGLDQNIVGAIKVFTEEYCTAHRIEKLLGPRDWVQILQDQIKLSRRRLKESCDYNKPASLVEVGKNVTD
ncbi:unnamed protein product [Coregonus sp. 'balchen']|nr:unnamed protein product [Coregonus sp. 'balchen']